MVPVLQSLQSGWTLFSLPDARFPWWKIQVVWEKERALGDDENFSDGGTFGSLPKASIVGSPSHNYRSGCPVTDPSGWKHSPLDGLQKGSFRNQGSILSLRHCCHGGITILKVVPRRDEMRWDQEPSITAFISLIQLLVMLAVLWR